MGYSKADAAHAVLRAAIIKAELVPGRPLRAAELSARYGLGLTPIREALTRLQAEGFVTLSRNRGFSVAPATLAELRDLARTRALLETELVIESLRRGDEDYEARVLAAHHTLARTPLPRLDGSRDVLDAWEERHDAFHAALVSGAGSDWLRRLWRIVGEHLQRYHRWLLLTWLGTGEASDPERAAADGFALEDVLAFEHHTRLLKAVLARDVSAAQRLLEEHMTLSTTAFLRLAGTSDLMAAGPGQDEPVGLVAE